MGQRIAMECRQRLLRHGTGGTVTILGLTFKENVPDTRNSKVADIVRDLASSGFVTQVHDPLAHADEAERQYGIKLGSLDAFQPADAVILAVAHDDYVLQGWSLVMPLLKGGTGIVLDVKSVLDRATKPEGIELWRL
jgi:UDP-N-acetyl-D-galactosamine dehydrogenase